MAALFHVDIYTPERLFLSDEVEALTVTTIDGQWQVLKGHVPITAPLSVGRLSVKKDGQWRTAFQSEGFLEVGRDGVVVFAQALEWPEEIDQRRAEEAEHRAKEKLRQRKSMLEYQMGKAALARAAERLRLKGIRLD